MTPRGTSAMKRVSPHVRTQQCPQGKWESGVTIGVLSSSLPFPFTPERSAQRQGPKASLLLDAHRVPIIEERGSRSQQKTVTGRVQNSRAVRFDSVLQLILVPSRSDLKGLRSDLWYEEEDYLQFRYVQMNAVELTRHLPLVPPTTVVQVIITAFFYRFTFYAAYSACRRSIRAVDVKQVIVRGRLPWLWPRMETYLGPTCRPHDCVRG